MKMFKEKFPIGDTPEELGINPLMVSPTTTFFRFGFDFYQLYLPVQLTRYEGYIMRVPEIKPEDVKELTEKK